MAAGSAFTLVPNVVITEVPEFHTVITDSEFMKKDYQNISSTDIQKYQLVFIFCTNTDRDILLTHYKDQYGYFHSFSWQSVPSYIGSGANITGRWVKESLVMSPTGNNYWDCKIIFEKDN